MTRRSGPQLEILPGRLRSANVERDTACEPRSDYVLTEATVELVRRLANTLVDPDSTRAWALTGPYGTGKSSFAVFLADLLCGDVDVRASALELVRRSDRALSERLARLLEAGVMRPALVTARREPITETVARAVEHATYGGTKPGSVRVPTDPALLLGMVTDLARETGLLIVIDEFGKTLEYHASSDSGTDDLYFLQELAELAAGRGLPRLCVLTMQHASFADYASRTSAIQRREWGKIQGRFHDYAIGESATDAAEFISGSIRLSGSDELTEGVSKAAQRLAQRWKELGLGTLLPPDPSLFAACYPLHPVALAALPRLCARLGQHDRTLSGILGADEPHSVARYVETTDFSSKGLPWYRLARVYDYFASSVRTSAVTLAGGRWLEIESRISEAHGVDDGALQVMKTIALLNLVSEGGELRASKQLLIYALGQDVPVVSRTLADLETRGLITYRSHADEFRLWSGSDIDVAARVRTARDAITGEDASALLAAEYAPAAIVAGRHSQETGILRHFTAAVVSGTSRVETKSNTDGYLLFSLDRSGGVPNIDTNLPVLVGESDSAERVTASAIDVLALRHVLAQPDLDAVARREVRERLAITQADLAATLVQAFQPISTTTGWTLSIGGRAPRKMDPVSSLSALVSAACDRAYAKSPTISNEMIGRHQLTSQGAKARRELATALITQPDLEQGGLHGFGPEVAMFKGVLEKLGLHGPDRTGVYGWRVPPLDSTAQPALRAIRELIRNRPGAADVESIQRELADAPWGVQAGLFPILILAVMMADADELIVLEDGSFQPRITAEHFERLIKSPGRFLLKYTDASVGLRGDFVAALSAAMEVPALRRSRSRNSSLVTLASALLAPLSAATPFAARTQLLDATARAVRTALGEARDPEALLFDALPQALGEEPMAAEAESRPEYAREMAQAIARAVRSISELPAVLQGRLDEAVVRATGTTSLREAREFLGEQAAGILDLPTEPKLRGVVHLSVQSQIDGEDWSRQLAMLTTGQSPSSWRDETLEAYPRTLQETLGTVRRLHALSFEPNAYQSNADILGRLTITGRDGSEDHRILDLPTANQGTVDKLIDDLLASAANKLGDRAPDLLLAGLVGRMTSVTFNRPGQTGTTP